jgi:hypothetical protein
MEQIDQTDLEIYQDDIQAAQENLDETLAKMSKVLATGNVIAPKLFLKAYDQIDELEIQVLCLKNALEKLQANA